MEDTLSAENIFFSAGNKNILKGVTLTARKGKITGLLGRNGAGKSTMLRVIFGIEKAGDKTIHVNSDYVTAPYKQRGLINYAPQYNFFPGSLTVTKALQLFDVAFSDIIDHFPEMEKDLHKTFETLSGGQARLWTVMILLMAKTRFTMLDEPFTHIMPVHIDRLKAVILREKMMKGIVITDHLYTHIMDISDSLYLMKDGTTVIIRNKEELVRHGYING